jgi:hypothetical protein
MSSTKIEYEQMGVYFECNSCPDCYQHYVGNGEREIRCHYYVNDWKIIDGVDVFKDIPDWCPRFPL